MAWQGLIREFFSDLEQPDLLWQALALVSCLLLALLFARFSQRQLRHRADQPTALAGRLLFPLVALALLLPTKAALALVIHTNILKVAVPLLVSLAIVRATIYVLRHAFSPSGWLAASERFVVLLIWGASFKTMPPAQKVPAGLIALGLVALLGLGLARWLSALNG